MKTEETTEVSLLGTTLVCTATCTEAPESAIQFSWSIKIYDGQTPNIYYIAKVETKEDLEKLTTKQTSDFVFYTVKGALFEKGESSEFILQACFVPPGSQNKSAAELEACAKAEPEEDGDLLALKITHTTRCEEPEVFTYWLVMRMVDEQAEAEERRILEEEPKRLFKNCRTLTMSQMEKLNEFYGNKEQVWQLLYRGSRDGFSASQFHSNCDGKGETFTVIRFSNYIFGGYSSISWGSDGDFMGDSNCFLFSLVNPSQTTPCKLPVVKVERSIQRHAQYGPIFGSDLSVHDRRCHCTPGIDYANPPVQAKSKGFFADGEYLEITDIEVFAKC